METYRATITAVGEFAGEFIDEGILVFFANSVPEELHEHALVHDQSGEQAEDVQVGDTIHLDGHTFPVLAVGEVANENLRNLGHLVLKFNGLEEPEMRGDVNVPAVPVPSLVVGSVLRITKEK